MKKWLKIVGGAIDRDMANSDFCSPGIIFFGRYCGDSCGHNRIGHPGYRH